MLARLNNLPSATLGALSSIPGRGGRLLFAGALGRFLQSARITDVGRGIFTVLHSTRSCLALERSIEPSAGEDRYCSVPGQREGKHPQGQN